MAVSNIEIKNYSWMTLAKFCELTGSDLSLVKENVKAKKELAKFCSRHTPRSQIFINYQEWLAYVTSHLRVA